MRCTAVWSCGSTLLPAGKANSLAILLTSKSRLTRAPTHSWPLTQPRLTHKAPRLLMPAVDTTETYQLFKMAGTPVLTTTPMQPPTLTGIASTHGTHRSIQLMQLVLSSKSGPSLLSPTQTPMFLLTFTEKRKASTAAELGTST